jgi:AcrR family transcriptional regulator
MSAVVQGAGGSRRANPRGQGARLRDELLAAATRLLESGGRDAALTLRGVAREAGVAAPSVYPHFADLDALMLELIRRHLADLGTAVRAALAPAEGVPARERLRRAAHAYVAWGLERPGPYLVVFEGRALRQLSVEDERALTAGDDLLTDFAGLLVELDPAPADPQLATVAMWTALHGLVALRTAKPSFPWPPLAAHVDATVAGVLAGR